MILTFISLAKNSGSAPWQFVRRMNNEYTLRDVQVQWS